MDSWLNISFGFFKAFSSYFVTWSIFDRGLIAILILFAHDFNSSVSIPTFLGSEIPGDILAAWSISALCPLCLTDELRSLAPLPSAYDWLLGFLRPWAEGIYGLQLCCVSGLVLASVGASGLWGPWNIECFVQNIPLDPLNWFSLPSIIIYMSIYPVFRNLIKHVHSFIP